MQTISAGEERKQLHVVHHGQRRDRLTSSLVNPKHRFEEEPSFPWWVGLAVPTSASALRNQDKVCILVDPTDPSFRQSNVMLVICMVD